MKATLKSLRATTANPAVSIFVKTHRTFPENEQDHIALKNQLKVAEERITKEYDKNTATKILEKIHAQTDDLDHNYNLDTLAIFASEDDVQVLRMPLDTPERVIIDTHFSTRELVRDMASAVHYYAVVITRDKARLIEGVNDRVVREFEKEDDAQKNMENIAFPIENNSLYKTGDGGSDRSAGNETSALKEYLNRVDKSVQELWGEHQMPLIIVGDKHNIGLYEAETDRPNNIIATVNNATDLEEGSPQHIVDSVQDALSAYRSDINADALGEIDKARGASMLSTDLQEIYRAAHQGAGETLYVREGYIQPALVSSDEQNLEVSLDVRDDPSEEGVMDDVVSEIIETTMHNGGKVVFLPEDTMPHDMPIALVTRYELVS